MTIASIQISPVTGATCIICDIHTGIEAWDLLELLKAAGLDNNVFIGCWNGFENCLVFVDRQPKLN